jgi:hypothetical protein
MTAWSGLLLPAGVTLSRSEGSVALCLEMLRGVYTERSECAQHDKKGSSQPLLTAVAPPAFDGLSF